VAEKILFVDDEPPVLEGLQRLLRREFAVSTAVGGHEGLASIEANGPYAVVISDMRMPEMNGVEFLAQVRERAPDSVRMLLTGHTDFEAAIAAVNRGNIFRYLTKPCEKMALMEAIQSGVEHYKTAAAQRELLQKARATEHGPEREPESGPDHQKRAALPGPAEAETYLQDFLGTDSQRYVVMIKLTMLGTVEDRYGEKAAADYRAGARQFLARILNGDDQLFQWSEDVLMAVIRRRISSSAVRMEINRLLMGSPQHLVDQTGRNTMVAITTSFEALPAADFATFDEMMKAFKAKPTGVV
jgi:YesN/AraC family two-component response regulator